MSNVGSALTYFLLMQLLLWVLLMAGGFYLLLCLGRTAANLDRVASALETLAAQREVSQDITTPIAPIPHAAPHSSAQTFVPASAAAAPPIGSEREI